MPLTSSLTEQAVPGAGPGTSQTGAPRGEWHSCLHDRGLLLQQRCPRSSLSNQDAVIMSAQRSGNASLTGMPEEAPLGAIRVRGEAKLTDIVRAAIYC